MGTIDIKLKSYDELQFEVTTLTTNSYLKDLKIKELQEIIDKAIEYTTELINDTKGIINDYQYEDKEKRIKQFIEDLETDIEHYKYLISILKGDNNDK